MDWQRLATRLAAGQMPAVERHALRDKLHAGPWLWPRADSMAVEACASLAGRPRPALPIAVLLASFGAARADLWLFPVAEHTPLATAVLAPNARRALDDALKAMARTLPIPRAVAAQHAFAAAVAGHLVSHAASGSAGAAPDAISGHSFGLAFGIVAAAVATQTAPRADILAIGELTEAGEVVAAEVDAKVELVARSTQTIVRLLVAKGQEVRVRQLLVAADRPDIEVLGVGSLAEALQAAFHGRLADDQLAAERDPIRRARALRRLWHQVRGGRQFVKDWSLVADMLERTSAAWCELPADAAAELEFLTTIAARHAGRLVRQLPNPDRLRHLPDVYRADVLANWIQNAADGADLDDAVLREVVERTRGTVNRGSAKLAGALGRYLQVQAGREREALQLMARAVEFWWREQDLENLSFPLSAALRLAGAVGDREAFDRLRVFADEVIEDQLVADPSYLQLALGTGLALLGDWLAADAALEQAARATHHVRPSALRWRIRCARKLGMDCATLEAESRAVAPKTGAWFVILADLDRAMDAGESGERQLAALLAHQQPPQGLQAVCAGVAQAQLAARVGRFFPY